MKITCLRESALEKSSRKVAPRYKCSLQFTIPRHDLRDVLCNVTNITICHTL